MDKIVTDLKILRQKSEKIELVETAQQKRLFERMEEVRKVKKAFGVAAIQIGEPFRACVILTPRGRIDMLNPVIIDQYEPTLISDEECLSLPGKKCITMRNIYCDVTWTDPKTGDLKQGIFERIEAVVVQHEIDHMDGILITDRVRKPVRREKPKIGRNDPCPKCGKKIKKCEHKLEFLGY